MSSVTSTSTPSTGVQSVNSSNNNNNSSSNQLQGNGLSSGMSSVGGGSPVSSSGHQNNHHHNNSSSSNNSEQLSRTNLYIRGLPQTTTDKDLLQLCGQYGTIISTKAILDKNTNKCKGYGFVDFESPFAAEAAVKALQASGIQAQMAKCTDTSRMMMMKHHTSAPSSSSSYSSYPSSAVLQNCSSYVIHNPSTAFNASSSSALGAVNHHHHHSHHHQFQPFTTSYDVTSASSRTSTAPNTVCLSSSQQEQDPTNLYIANLPPYMAEAELEAMLAPYGTVISTRILRDGNHQPRGVGFARMDAKDKCDVIISAFNGKVILGSKEPLLVKFADGGNKKKSTSRSSGGGSWKDYSSSGGSVAGSSDHHHHHHAHHQAAHHHQMTAIHYAADPSQSMVHGQNGMAAAAAAQLMPVSMATGYRQPYPTSNAQQMHAAASYGQAAAAAAAAYQSHQQQQQQQTQHGHQQQQQRTGNNSYGSGGQVHHPGQGTYGQALAAAAAAAAAAGYQTRPFTANSPHIQQAAGGYPGAGGAAGASGHPWIAAAPHPGAPAGAYHLIQSPTGHMQATPAGMIPSQTLQALHLSALMPQISAQMSQLQLSGPPFYPSGPNALYAAQGTPLIQQANGGGDGGSGTSSVGPQDQDIQNSSGKGQQQQNQNQSQSYQVCSQSK